MEGSKDKQVKQAIAGLIELTRTILDAKSRMDPKDSEIIQTRKMFDAYAKIFVRTEDIRGEHLALFDLWYSEMRTAILDDKTGKSWLSSKPQKLRYGSNFSVETDFYLDVSRHFACASWIRDKTHESLANGKEAADTCGLEYPDLYIASLYEIFALLRHDSRPEDEVKIRGRIKEIRDGLSPAEPPIEALSALVLGKEGAPDMQAILDTATKAGMPLNMPLPAAKMPPSEEVNTMLDKILADARFRQGIGRIFDTFRKSTSEGNLSIGDLFSNVASEIQGSGFIADMVKDVSATTTTTVTSDPVDEPDIIEDENEGRKDEDKDQGDTKEDK